MTDYQPPPEWVQKHQREHPEQRPGKHRKKAEEPQPREAVPNVKPERAKKTEKAPPAKERSKWERIRDVATKAINALDKATAPPKRSRKSSGRKTTRSSGKKTVVHVHVHGGSRARSTSRKKKKRSSSPGYGGASLYRPLGNRGIL